MPVTAIATCRAYQNAATGNIFTNAAFSNVPADTESWDHYGMHEGVTNPSRITIPAGHGGLYRLYGQVGCSLTAGNTVYLQWLLNGTTPLSIETFNTAITGSNYYFAYTEYDLVPGDYVQLQFWHNFGSARAAIAGSPHLTFIGATFVSSNGS